MRCAPALLTVSSTQLVESSERPAASQPVLPSSDATYPLERDGHLQDQCGHALLPSEMDDTSCSSRWLIRRLQTAAELIAHRINRRAAGFTKPEPCRWTRTRGRTVPLWANELPEQHSKHRPLRRRRSVVAARAWVSVSAGSIVVVFSGAVRLGELRSRACRCSRGHRPSGCDTEATGRRVTLPQRHRRGVGGSLTQTPLRRAYRLQRPCSLPIVRA